MKKNGIILVFVTALLSACQPPAERAPEFEQNMGSDLLLISDYDNQTFELLTHEKMRPAPMSTISDAQLAVQNGVSVPVQNFYQVKFSTKAKLLPDIPLIGLPNQEMRLVYRLSDKSLRVYKQGFKSQMPFHELKSATKVSGKLDQWEVPLISYPVFFYTTERVLGPKGEPTHKIREFGKETKDQATHFKILYNQREVLSVITKLDLFPREYFQGSWYYGETVVGTRDQESIQIGLVRGYDQTLQEARKVEFCLFKDQLKVVNSNIDERLRMDCSKMDVNYPTVISIPAELQDFQLSQKGYESGMNEEERNDQTWDQKRFVHLEFTKTTSSVRQTLSMLNNSTESRVAQESLNAAVNDNRLVDLEMTDNYFSFTVQTGLNNTRVKYSFLRTRNRPSYTPKSYPKADQERFGLFSTQKAVVNNYEIKRESNIDENTFVTRFNPKVKKIPYHFTKGSPHWARVYGRSAIANWNWGLKRGGLGFELELVEAAPGADLNSADVEPGDLRYNSINLIETLSSSQAYGFGPSVVDSTTGEIISVTTNIHLTSIHSAMDESVSNFIRLRTGQLQENILSPLLSILGVGELEKSNIAFSNIQRMCPEVMNYIEELKSVRRATPTTYLAGESEILGSCSRKISGDLIMTALVHEIGHNLGLRHNFMGSMDSGEEGSPHFWSKEETGTPYQVRFSSVMDYGSPSEPGLVVPGKYDLAALQYAYLDEIDSGQTFRYCSDEKAMTGYDPMCQPGDAGTSPLEVVTQYMNGYYAQYVFNGFRYDRLWPTSSIGAQKDQGLAIAQNRTITTFPKLRQFYDHWRNKLAATVGIDQRYLEDYEEAEYFEKLQGLTKDPAFEETYRSYFPAVQKIYQFYKTVATMPGRYCVVQDSNQKIDLIDFEILRESLALGSKRTYKSCMDQDVENYLRTRLGLSVLKEVGVFVGDIQYDMSKSAIDVVGSKRDRLLAQNMLTMRANTAMGSATSNMTFAPNFLDEPQFRKDWTQTVVGRITKGISAESFGFNADSDWTKSEIVGGTDHFRKFNTERLLILASYIGLVEGLKIPENESESKYRRQKFYGLLTPHPEIIKSGVDSYKLPIGGSFVIPTDSADYAQQFVHTARELDQMKENSKPVDFAKFRILIERLKLALPEPGKTQVPSTLIALLKTMGNLQAEGVLTQDLGFLVNSVLGSELMAATQVMQEYAQSLQSSMGVEEIAKIENPEEKFNAFVKKLDEEGRSYPTQISRENIEQRINQMKQGKDLYSDWYLKNRSEFQAQSDILQMIFKFEIK